MLTGATGYLGSHLAEALLHKGYSVIALKRKTSSLRRLEAAIPRMTLLDVEGIEFESVFNKYGKVDAVIHCATSYGRNGESASQIS